MKRRAVVSMCSALFTVSAGCSSNLGSVPTIESDGVSKISLSIVSYADSEPNRPIPHVSDPPRITVDEESSQITILGRILGGGECHEIYLADAAFENESLVIVLDEEFIAYPWSGCPGAMTSEIYRIAVEFEAELPKTVTVHENANSNHSTTVEI